jgi:dephospho-CoA kinase
LPVIVIGLTGGIASGKSAASEALAGLGAVVIDADRIGHEVLRSNADARREVVAAFGKGILDHNGELDRGKLADIVFNDPVALRKLNGIMHPMMRKIVERRIEELRGQGAEVVVLEAALLIEANWTDLADQVWVVAAPESDVLDRLSSQKGFTEEQARARIEAQMPAAQRLKHADAVIENDSDLDTLKKKVEGLWQRLQSSDNS